MPPLLITRLTHLQHPVSPVIVRNSYTQYIACIDEDNCIGCTKCISACPADAIIGAKLKLHTVVATYCTGCQLCVVVCPTNCIAMQFTPKSISYWAAKKRYAHHVARTYHANSLKKTTPITPLPPFSPEQRRKKMVEEAISRATIKQQRRQQQIMTKHDESNKTN